MLRYLQYGVPFRILLYVGHFISMISVLTVEDYLFLDNPENYFSTGPFSGSKNTED
ncbi:hypothetical protein BDV41DRAFT_525558 [Aspergillus transmontanensis]|uniref:Uncharacterized protein n=1 Tax=Aspergillus transmontanensis TaxID=1034304 RepID=A0A5N6W9F9_9EURO|nr:hypothetical protein BDV41DRAFT_525558 [Aspergillus transmontanensis]